MADYEKLMAEASELEAKAQALRKKAHSTRRLPKEWRIGQRVRFLQSVDWAWNRGQEGIINRVRLNDYKFGDMLWTTLLRKDGTPVYGSYLASPSDVELVEDAMPEGGTAND